MVVSFCFDQDQEKHYADGMKELSFFNSVMHHSMEDHRRFTEDTAKTFKWCNIYNVEDTIFKASKVHKVHRNSLYSLYMGLFRDWQNYDMNR